MGWDFFLEGYILYDGEGHGNALQYSCLENPMDRGAWRATVHGVTKNWTRLNHETTTYFVVMVAQPYKYIY